MSRWIEEKPEGGYLITLDDGERCKHMYNEICCNDASPRVADYPGDLYCRKCPLYEREDMEGING